jgi:recombinational DNA repair ATPase RecF
MRLQHVQISDYNNLKDLSLSFDSDSFLDVLAGKTGTGKPNFFEALIEIFRHLVRLLKFGREREGVDLTDNDQLVYVNSVILGKLLESETFAKQASSNTKEQSSKSPDLKLELTNAIIEAFDAHSEMSKQALNSEKIQEGLMSILLSHSMLYEKLLSGSEA